MIRLVGLSAILLVAGGAIYTSDRAHDAADDAARAAQVTKQQDRSSFLAICRRGNLVRGYLILDERNGRKAERRAGIKQRKVVAEHLFQILDCEQTYASGGRDFPVNAVRRERFIRALPRR